MSVNAASWENQLLDMAYAGINSPANNPCLEVGEGELLRAYEHCSAITASHSRTFSLASGLLPPKKRDAARALYAFCRMSDDIVDRLQHDKAWDARSALEQWRRRAVGECESPSDPLIMAWADTQATYGIPRLYAEQLIDGVARDIEQDRYDTFEDLTSYCYGVASTVGLMAMHVIGFSGPEAIPYAVKLGVALQLTNILRDIAEDWSAGRLYLPLEELERFNLAPSDIARGQVTGRWRAFMAFQIARVRAIYAESLPGIQMLHRDGRFAIGTAAELYAAILTDIEAHNMDVFSRRAHVTTVGKLRRLPGLWWRANVTGYGPQPESSSTDEPLATPTGAGRALNPETGHVPRTGARE
ncbi:MAG: phytoene/squalene synthase family protein [Anaerolineae bacterium]|nr:phytoene/squalene synthase family protein [Anaerolineae bacterium]